MDEGFIVVDDSKLVFDSNYDENAFSKSEFNYYVHLFEEIQAAGGCVCVDNLDGENIGSNEWFNQMVGSGRILIDMFDDEKKEWTETSVTTCTTQNYLQQVQDDSNVDKAEADYEYALNIINAKDTRFDQELSKLETKKKAYENQMESLKTTIQDNIEKTFDITN